MGRNDGLSHVSVASNIRSHDFLPLPAANVALPRLRRANYSLDRPLDGLRGYLQAHVSFLCAIARFGICSAPGIRTLLKDKDKDGSLFGPLSVAACHAITNINTLLTVLAPHLNRAGEALDLPGCRYIPEPNHPIHTIHTISSFLRLLAMNLHRFKWFLPPDFPVNLQNFVGTVNRPMVEYIITLSRTHNRYHEERGLHFFKFAEDILAGLRPQPKPEPPYQLCRIISA